MGDKDAIIERLIQWQVATSENATAWDRRIAALEHKLSLSGVRLGGLTTDDTIEYLSAVSDQAVHKALVAADNQASYAAFSTSMNTPQQMCSLKGISADT